MTIHADFNWSLPGSGQDFVDCRIDVSNDNANWLTIAYHQMLIYNGTGGGGRGPPLFPISGFHQISIGTTEIIYWRIQVWRTTSDDTINIFSYNGGLTGGVDVTIECIRTS